MGLVEELSLEIVRKIRGVPHEMEAKRILDLAVSLGNELLRTESFSSSGEEVLSLFKRLGISEEAKNKQLISVIQIREMMRAVFVFSPSQ